MTRREPLEVLTVCGVGMGSSLMLKMTVENALSSMGVEARVECTDISTARGMNPDVVIGQQMHTGDLEDLAPVVLAVSDFLDSAAMEKRLSAALDGQGWLR